MKKTIFALAVMALASSAFATNFGQPSSGSASAGVKSSSVAGAASSGNGTAYTATRGGQFASSTQSAGASLTGSFQTGQAGGKADVSGTTLAGGYAESYTKTTGAGIAGSTSFGEACAQSEGAAAFYNPLTGARGVVAGSSTSVNSNFAATGAAGNGEAYRGNWSENGGGYSAHADASGKVRFGTPRENLSANTSAEAWSNSYKGNIAPSFTNGTAIGVQGNVNFGAAGSLANAQVGNRCSGNGC
jgi:hypothetical protein